MRYFIQKKITELIENLAISNVSGFYPSLISRQLNYKPEEYIPILEDLVSQGVLKHKYILINPENPLETKEFEYSDIPFGEYYDEFHFGEEIFVTENDVVMYYEIRSEFVDELKKTK